MRGVLDPGTDRRTDGPPATSHQRSRMAVRALVLVVTVMGVLTVLPSLPAAWRGLTHLGAIGDDAIGSVDVSKCSRGDLLFDWTCRGIWSPNDSMATPVNPMLVTVVNDPRDLPKGTNLSYVYVEPGTHDGFNAGAMEQIRTVALWLGVLCGIATLVVLTVTRRRRSIGLPLITLAAGVVLIAFAWPLV